ncbi:MAG: type II toxin-antitoxin system prevent-host-death family antitoxin [Lachnospiraceae bacterium]
MDFISFNELAEHSKETKEPVIITVNGRGDTALLALQTYRQMEAELELYRTLAEAEEDVRNGSVAPIDETFKAIKALLNGNSDV